jgi:hypothetical protein
MIGHRFAIGLVLAAFVLRRTGWADFKRAGVDGFGNGGLFRGVELAVLVGVKGGNGFVAGTEIFGDFRRGRALAAIGAAGASFSGRRAARAGAFLAGDECEGGSEEEGGSADEADFHGGGFG